MERQVRRRKLPFLPQTTNINSKPREGRYEAGLGGYLLYPIPLDTPEGSAFQKPLFRAYFR